MNIQEFARIDPSNVKLFKLRYQVYRFLKRPELYQVIEKFNGKAYSKRFESALKKCAEDLAQKGYIKPLLLNFTPKSYDSDCCLISFNTDIYFYQVDCCSEEVCYTFFRNEKKLHAGNTIFLENALTNINKLKKVLRKSMLSFLKTVHNYEQLKIEIEQKQNDFKQWHDLISDQYSCFVLKKMGLKRLV